VIDPVKLSRPQLWIMRHGETEWSKSGQYTGLTDLPLTVEGEQQAVEARKILEGIEFDLVLTSPLRRARRTAELAGFPDAVHEPLAVEWDYGDYEGISSDLIRKDNPDYLISPASLPPAGSNWTPGKGGTSSSEPRKYAPWAGTRRRLRLSAGASRKLLSELTVN
jgi:probable phosphoglycerate mutase